MLCEKLHGHLVEKKYHFKILWLSFYWYVPSGSHEDIFGGNYYYYFVYTGGVMWIFIPETVWLCWIEKLRSISNLSGSTPLYQEFKLNNPPPILEDNTIDLHQFEDSSNSFQLARVICEMKN